MINARYAHTNLIAADWRKLADFYENVFGGVPVPPIRHISEAWLSEATGLPNAEIEGVHLHLPGYGEQGPTLEIFTYAQLKVRTSQAPNQPGFGHIAFAVDDVPEARAAVLTAGGIDVGEIISANIPNAGNLTFVYMADPEGNLLELQQWE